MSVCCTYYTTTSLTHYGPMVSYITGHFFTQCPIGQQSYKQGRHLLCL